jgi:hypothetical protein
MYVLAFFAPNNRVYYELLGTLYLINPQKFKIFGVISTHQQRRSV